MFPGTPLSLDPFVPGSPLSQAAARISSSVPPFQGSLGQRIVPAWGMMG